MTNFIKLAATTLIGFGGVIAYEPAANAGQMFPRSGQFCPSNSINRGNGYCEATGNNQFIPISGQTCPYGTVNVGNGYCRN